MPGGNSKIASCHRSLAGVAVILVFMTCGGIPGPAAAAQAEPILQLTPDIDRYFLGPYLAYLEDPQKKLTIEDVSSPQMSIRFVKHAGKILNLGLDSSAYWIRFTTDTFEELGGSGVALGVMEDSIFKAYTKTALRGGQIIFLSTDGIWESRNQKREMFGKKPIYDIIRNNASLTANEILTAMLESLKQFQQGAKIEDDITLVVIKIKD